MLKVLVVGAGAQGGPCASILTGEGGVGEIRLADVNFEVARKAAEKIDSSKILPLKLDASKKEEIVKASEGVDVIINLTY